MGGDGSCEKLRFWDMLMEMPGVATFIGWMDLSGWSVHRPLNT